MTRFTLTADRVATAETVWSPGFVTVEGSTVVALGQGSPGLDAGATEHVSGAILPGFVDQHVHGALGVDFGRATPEEARRVAHFHAATGSTRLVASIATAPLPALEQALSTLAPLVDDGTLAGLHLEGPYLSAVRRGAHDPALLRQPSVAELAALLEAGAGSVRQVTIAPELPGALDAVAWLVSQGVTVALGHSDADFDTARRAIDLGATVATHLFNGMRPLGHREPGLVGAVLDDERVLLELILDGHHVASPVASLVRRVAPGRLALVSDAMSATGLGDGEYAIAGSPVVVTEGVAMLADGSSLAGSTATVADALVRLGAAGVTLPEAVAATSAAAVRTLGLAEGLAEGLAAGSRADLVVVDDTLRARRVLRAGLWL
ncbi:N-acetylglucosamine-6-phosphate deacetylase [Frondihabitans sucicola]|uniref:N-acetylglucosamine-6-phosphate deacetylase n=1 Tax=Frondihabitans sucicola TaxID=1268041 RepID=A0ABM8GMY1_9MICO|nr:amidohydrolase family protein [Frondihabitans sucicola]BDZ49787.1 N-acetylglucosamine-6-phosphate deacetylase [Frondihabitans sucicola]